MKKKGPEGLRWKSGKRKGLQEFWGKRSGRAGTGICSSSRGFSNSGETNKSAKKKKVEMISTGVQVASFSSAERRHYHTIFANAHAISAMNGDKNRVTYHFRKGKKKIASKLHIYTASAIARKAITGLIFQPTKLKCLLHLNRTFYTMLNCVC